jgi:hypothetical protein
MACMELQNKHLRQIEAFVANLFDGQEDLSVEVGKLAVTPATPADNAVRIRVSRMYRFVTWNFDTLEKISDFLGTKTIKLGEQDFIEGCESCDYGSKYWVEFHVFDITKVSNA